MNDFNINKVKFLFIYKGIEIYEYYHHSLFNIFKRSFFLSKLPNETDFRGPFDTMIGAIAATAYHEEKPISISTDVNNVIYVSFKHKCRLTGPKKLTKKLPI